MIWSLPGGGRLDFGARVQVFGILNVTPDSFYDGGRHDDPQAAVERGLRMVEEGAHVIDLGGESSRPPIYGRAVTVDADEEIRRVVPVVEALRRADAAVPLSVDTVKPEVARAALAAGADMVNDISAFEAGGPDMAAAVAEAGAGAVLMHRRGTPETMQRDTHYDDLVGEVRAYLEGRVDFAEAHGVPASRLAVDPGIGFGKSAAGNRQLIDRAGVFAVRGCPVLAGASRKSFLWKPAGLSPEQALEASLAAAVIAVLRGARAVRVHDVAETARALRLAEEILAERPAAAA